MAFDLGQWLHERFTSPEQLQQESMGPTYWQGNAFTGPMSQAEWKGHVDTLTSIPGITQDEIDLYMQRMQANPDQAPFLTQMASQAVANREFRTRLDKDEAYRAEQERQVGERRTQGLADIEGLQGQGNKLYGEQINRIQGFLENPSSIRSDAQLGKRLTDVESLLAGQLGEIRKGAAKTVSQAGLRAAGKVDTGIRAAEQNATAMQGKNISSLLGELGAEKTSLGTQQLGFNAGLTQARDTVRGGGIADLSNLRSQAQSIRGEQHPGIDYSSPTLSGYDIKGLGYGKQATDAGMWMQLASMLMQQGQNSTGQVMQLLGGLGGK